MVIDASRRGEIYTQVRRPFVFAPFGIFALFTLLLNVPIAMGIAALGLWTTKIVPPTLPAAKIRYALKRARFKKRAGFRAKRRARKQLNP